MATQRDEITIVPADPNGPASESRSLYDRDLYTWSQEQARLIRAGRLGAIDRDNVAEEIESLGREQFNKLESAYRVLLLHMLKWDFQPERRSRSWTLSIATQRLEIDDLLADNPGLEPRVAEAIARAYRKARLEAAKETGLDLTRFPEACSYGQAEIADRPFDVETPPSP